jgi:hypothetical protein
MASCILLLHSTLESGEKQIVVSKIINNIECDFCERLFLSIFVGLTPITFETTETVFKFVGRGE